ncbi:MAG: agmatine deiminase family protein [bacterium]|nr:agmatine deiminase family protein [bacterium]
MITRRRFIQTLAILSGGIFIKSVNAESLSHEREIWFMPDEAEPHKRTWMAFCASKEIWGDKLLPEVRRNLATIARTIAKYEPVSMLVGESDHALAKKLIGSSSVELIVLPLDDLWMRDTGPVFVMNKKGQKAGVDFNFNGWGKKQAFGRDANVAGFVSKHANVDVVGTKLVLEGGGIEVDGHGTAIITESCVLNPNRNPGVSKEKCEAELKALLGLKKIIWLPGVKGKDITDGHTDFYARFARPGVVVAGFDPDPESFDHPVTKKHLEILESSIDANGRKLEVVVIAGPEHVREAYESNDFAAGYINFHVCNGAVIAPEFGDDKADRGAEQKLRSLFPDRDIVQINIDGIAAGGGGIHCTTQQEPMA